jgi:elongation factor G
MPVRRRRRSASCTTRAARTSSARCTRAPRRWTGWSRSRSAASPSRPPPPPVSGALRRDVPDQHHRHPGHVDFTVEVERSLRVLDGAVAVFDAVSAWSRSRRRCGARRTSTACRASASSTRWTVSAPTSSASSDMIRDRLGANAHPVQLPIGEGETFTGVVDIIRRVELIYDDSTLGKNWTEQPVRAELQDKVEELRTTSSKRRRARRRADGAYLEGEEITEDELRSAIRKATIAGAMTPVSAAPPSRTRACSSSSTRSSTTCRRRSTSRRSGARRRRPGEGDRARADDDEPFAALAFKIMNDPYVGKLTFFRVYSGVLKPARTC